MKLLKYLAFSLVAGLIATSMTLIKLSHADVACYQHVANPYATIYNPDQRGWPDPFLHAACIPQPNVPPASLDGYRSGFTVTAFAVDVLLWSVAALLAYALASTFWRHYKHNKRRTIIASLLIILAASVIGFSIFAYLVGQALNGLTF